MLHLALANPADRVTESIQALPWSAHAAVALALAAGLVLWASGRQVLRPVIGFFSGATGALVAFVMLPVVAPAAGVSPIVGALGGLVLGLLGGFLLYRAAVAVTFGVALGGASGLVAAAVLSIPGVLVVQKQSTNDSPVPAAVVTSEGVPPLVETELAAEVERVSAASREFAVSLKYAAEFAWEDVPPRNRYIIGGAAAVGLIAGALLGFSLPAWAAGAVTALVGGAIWLPCAVWLMEAAGAPGRDAIEQLPPTGWTILWLVASSVGLAVQWAGLMKKPAPKAQPA